MGLKMNTGAVKSQLSDMNRNLDTMVTHANVLQSRISMFTETQALLAAATYDSIREYYASVHMPLLQGLICYAEELKEANENYSSQIDSWLDADYVDEDGLQEDLETIIHCRDRLNNIEEWGPATYALDHTLEQMQWKIEEKLERIEAFLSATAGIYTRVDKSALIQGISCMQGIGYNANTGIYDLLKVDLSWSTGVQERWKQRESKDWDTNVLIGQIKKEHPKITYREVEIILQTMTSNPQKTGQSAEDYLRDIESFIQEIPGITVQGTGILNDVLIDIYTKHGKWIEENAANILQNSSGTMDDMLRYADDIAESTGFIRKGQTLTSAGKVLPFIGAGLDFGGQLLSGEDVGDAAIKTGAHVALGLGSTAIVGLVIGTTPVGWAAVGAAALGYAAGKVFDWAYDTFEEDFVEGVKHIADDVGEAIDKVGDAVSGFFSGISKVFA